MDNSDHYLNPSFSSLVSGVNAIELVYVLPVFGGNGGGWRWRESTSCRSPVSIHIYIFLPLHSFLLRIIAIFSRFLQDFHCKNAAIVILVMISGDGSGPQGYCNSPRDTATAYYSVFT